MRYKHMLKQITFFFSIAAIIVFLSACEGEFVPKPKGWNRIDLPEHSYQPLKGTYPYYFEYAENAKVVDDTTGLSEPYWIQIIYPEMDAEVDISYKAIGGDRNRFYEIINDAHKLTSKHQVKAYSIEQTMLKTKKQQTAVVFELAGEVPSQIQFYVTDSTQHFLRGALYFKTATSNDSLAPVISYIKEDVMHLLNTLEWNDSVTMPSATGN